MQKYGHVKDYLLIAVEKFGLDIENLPNLLGISKQKLNMILNDEPCELTVEESDVVFHRAFMLAEGLTYLTPEERMRVIIKTNLIGECKLSNESLAKYACVPVEVFNDFLDNDVKIEDKYLTNIYFNLYLLFNLLYTNSKSNR